jgi:hypothetical protein
MIVILCGMPEEHGVIFGVFPTALILSGTDKLNLPKLVPPETTRLIVSGLFGGLSAGIPVGGICAARTIVDKAGDVFTCDAAWNEKVKAAGTAENLTFGVVPWYSSGLLDEADSTSQRAAIFRKYHTNAIDDEARYAVALAKERPGLLVNDFRSCSDDWTESLPLAATGAIMNADGSADIPYLLRSIASEPLYQTLDLFKIGVDFKTSLDTLEFALNATKGVFLT